MNTSPETPPKPDWLIQLKANLSKPVPQRSWDEIKQTAQADGSQIEETEDMLTVRQGEGFLTFDRNGRIIFSSTGKYQIVEQEYTPEGYLSRQEQRQYGGFGFENIFKYEQKPDGTTVPTHIITQHFSGAGNLQRGENSGTAIITPL